MKTSNGMFISDSIIDGSPRIKMPPPPPRIKSKNERNDNMKTQTIIDHFEIPEELAKELSDLLTKQVVRERMLMQLIDDEAKYDTAEGLLSKVVSKIEAIKVKITREYVPQQYRTPKYMWNYNGWDVDENRVEVLEEK